MKTSLTTSLVKPLLDIASIDDVRYYLNGVCIEWHSGRWQAIATDGHVLMTTWGVCADVEFMGKTIIIPRETLKLALDAKSELDVFSLEPTNEGKWIISAGSGNTVRELVFRPVDGRYPQWRNVIPRTEPTGEKSFVHPFLTAKVQKAFNMMRGLKATNQTQVMSIAMNGNGASIVACEDLNAVGIIMPMRVEPMDKQLANVVSPAVTGALYFEKPEPEEKEAPAAIEAANDDPIQGFETLVKIVADDVDAVRKIDVERLLDEAKQQGDTFAKDFAEWLKVRRPGLKAEINKLTVEAIAA